MNRKNLFIISLVLLCLPIAAFKPVNDNNKKIVVIDAGHGGKDSGAMGLNTKEKDVVLTIALKVGKYIQQNMPNVKVIYTRSTDVFIPLHERANIANKNGADLFVSIHANSNSNSKAYGTDSFVMGSHKNKSNLEVAKKENSVIILEEDYNTRYEGFEPNSSESYIMFSMMTSNFVNQSIELASNVQNEFRDRVHRKDRGVKMAGFLVLWRTTMPSVLIETGFLSNPTEEKYLASEQGQTFIASAIYRAIKQYINSLIEDEKEMGSTNIQTLVNENMADTAVKKSEPAPIAVEENKNETYFRIQILSSSKKVAENSGIYNKYADIYEYQENSMFKYAIGNYKSLLEAKEMQSVIKPDFPDAFIVAFRNGKKIPLKQALKK